MGQAYCDSCCGGQRDINTNPPDIRPVDTDEPSPKFAKPVRSMIEVHPKVRETFIRQRTAHIPERKGTKLTLFYLFQYGAYYDGDWKNGLPHGFGRLIYDDGSIYQGCFRQGLAECRKALFIKENGTFYKGQVKMNKAYGEGSLTNDKITYRGSWDNDLPHGDGQQIYNRLSYYTGNFQKGVKSGHGRYQWNTAEYYEGQFDENQINGVGRHVTRQYEYEGQFLKGQKHGKGKLKNVVKGWTYEGDFRHNKMEGKGVYTWADRTRFQGSFENNQKKEGKLILQNGEQINDFGN